MTKKDLIKKCEDLNISTTNLSSSDLVRLLGNYYLKVNGKSSWGLNKIRSLTSPSLALDYNKLKPAEQADLWDDDNYVVELKENGVRILITYHPRFGFQFFSRGISVKDFLPIEYKNIQVFHKPTHKVLVDSRNIYHSSFILDTEILLDKVIDRSLFKSKHKTEKKATILSSITTILSLNIEESHLAQNNNYFKFKAFDIIYHKKWLLDTTFFNRKKLLKKVADTLSMCFRVENHSYHTDKKAYFDKIIKEGHEGVVLKHLDSLYNNSITRNKSWIKVKKSLVDIDAFIIGFVPPNKNTKHAANNLIGSLKLGIYKNNEVFHIATCGNLTDSIREKVTKDGKLNNKYLDRVVTVSGFCISHKTERIVHAFIDWNKSLTNGKIGREDKNKNDCIL